MSDVVTPEVRSRMMSGIRGKNTKPELIIRKNLHRLGYRYRLHAKELPGKPDLVLPKYNAVIFVNGCFWHGHACHLFKWPQTREDFWRNKITVTKEKDRENKARLHQQGWRIMEIWECSLKGKTRLPVDIIMEQIALWLQSESPYMEIQGKQETS